MIQTTQTGLEPVTSAVTGRRSNQLSHWAMCRAREAGMALRNRVAISELSGLSNPQNRIRKRTFLVYASDLLVTFSYIHYCTSTYDLSTLSSSRGLCGYLILRGASRLDAFSVYPVQTWLLCDRIGS